MLKGFAEQSLEEKSEIFFHVQKSFVRYIQGCSRNGNKVVKIKVKTKQKVDFLIIFSVGKYFFDILRQFGLQNTIDVFFVYRQIEKESQ